MFTICNIIDKISSVGGMAMVVQEFITSYTCDSSLNSNGDVVLAQILSQGLIGWIATTKQWYPASFVYSPKHGVQMVVMNVSLDIENISVLKQKKQKQSTQNNFYYSRSSLEYFSFWLDWYLYKNKKLNSINAKYIT